MLSRILARARMLATRTAKAPIRSKKSTQLLRGRPKPLGVLEGRPYPPALTRPGRRLRGPGITGSASKVKLAPGSWRLRVYDCGYVASPCHFRRSSSVADAPIGDSRNEVHEER